MPDHRYSVEQFLCRTDNIALLLCDKSDNTAIAIDAPDGAGLLAALRKTGRSLKAILITHHHTDHTDGLALLKRETGAEIYAPVAEAAKIPLHDRLIEAEAEFSVSGFTVHALATPGHTLGELSYYLRREQLVFTGDTLFSLGCGRIFEGDAAIMFRSLQKLAALPSQTKIYCGHEYSAANARFALTLEPHNQALQQRAKEINALRAANALTLPQTIAQELAANPFLRCDSAEIRRNLACAAGSSDETVFAEMRQRKDNFS